MSYEDIGSSDFKRVDSLKKMEERGIQPTLWVSSNIVGSEVAPPPTTEPEAIPAADQPPL